MNRLLIASIAAAVLATTAGAQTTTYGPLAFRIPASARTLGMADIGVVGRDDDVLFYNPAQLNVARGTSLSFERMMPDVYGGTMSTNLRLGPGGVGIGVNYLEFPSPFGIYPISRGDAIAALPILGPASTLHAAVGYSQTVKGVRAGVSVNYGVDEIGVDKFRNVAVDVGFAKDFDRWTVGLALQHLGMGMRSENTIGVQGDSVKLPAKATLGAGWSGSAGPLDVTALIAASGTQEGHVSPAAGTEINWSWLSGYSIAGRAGVRYPANVDDPKYTGGFGFTADRISIDLAAEVMHNDHVGYRAGIRIR